MKGEICVKKIISLFLSAIVLLTIPVANAKAESGKLIIDKVSTSSAVVQPGEKFTLNFSLKNNLDVTVKNIVIKITGIEGKNALGGFSPVGTTNEIYCNDLSSGDSEQASIDLISDPTLKSGTYNLVVDLKYTEKDGSSYEDNRIVGVAIANKANVIITSLSTNDGTQAGSTKKVSLNFVNAGVTSLKEVVLTITANKSTYLKYFGTVDADDENSFEQNLPIDGNVTGNVEISYKDDMNTEGKVTKNFSIKAPVNNKTQTKSNQAKKGFFESIASFFKSIFGLGD